MTTTPPLDLAAFLAGAPWPKDALALGEPLDFFWSIDVDATAAQLWPYVMDTSHMNRALGLGARTYRQVEGALHGSGRHGGFLHEWIEEPWVWVARSSLTAVRRYQRGFAHYARVIHQLEPIDEGRRVRVHCYFGWIPRGAFGRFALRRGVPALEAPGRKVYAELAQHLRDEAATRSPFVAPPPELTDAARAKLATLAGRLLERARTRGLPAAAVERLVDHLGTADELDLHRLRLVPLAQRWGLGVDDLLGVCLHATRIGLLTLSWDVTCPHCRGVVEERDRLDALTERAACAVCAIDFATSEPASIEISFRLHPSVRQVEPVFYCAAEPARKPHILVQQRLRPGEERRVATLLEPGRYRLRIDGEKRYRLLELTAGQVPSPRPLLRWAVSDDGPLELGGAEPELHLVNDADGPRGFVLEQAGVADDALRPVRLFSMQEFRDLFSEEFLGTDVQLSVGEQTILFTDMIGSTRFYDLRGDPGAFSQVRWHFSIIYEIVRRHRGAVIKTIGDAVMAAFHDAVDALRASVEIHAAFYAGRPDTLIRLRISMNRGPCIAVNLNSSIDYFGRTVNSASKLQACVEAGQVAFPRSMTEAPGVAAYLEESAAKLEEVIVTSASLSGPILAYRWDLNERSPTPTPG